MVPERDINQFAAGGIPMVRIRKMFSLYNIAALHQADQFCPVTVKGTADQEVPVVTATVLVIILVWSLCHVNASLFAFCVKEASRCNLWDFGKKLQGKEPNPSLAKYRLYWRSSSLFSSPSATRCLRTSCNARRYIRAHHNSYPGFLTFSFCFSIHPPSFLASPLSSFNFGSLHGSCNSHYALFVSQFILQYCTGATFWPTCEL